MTPQERALVADLFDRLAKLENAPRDADAERAIEEGLQRAPGAVYALVQTVLVQDEALKRADARIRELEGGDTQSQQQGGFLDTTRNSLFGGGPSSRGSVPSVRPGQPDPRWNAGAAPMQAPVQAGPVPMAQGGSFLGTAAAAAAGVIGGSLLLNSISSMFGHHGSAFSAYQPDAGSPWGNSNASGSDLARDAGVNDIGRGGFGSGEERRAGLLDTNDVDNDNDNADFADNSDFGGFDDGGGSDA